MTQDTTGTSLQHSEKPQLPRQSAYLSSITRTYLVLALTVAILGTLLASSVGRGLAFRGLSSIRYPVYGAERNLRSYASFGRNSFEQHTAVSENEMASITKAKAEDCATGKAETKLTPAEEARWNRISDGMNAYHNHFRYEFNRVYTLADGGFHKEGMSLGRFLREAQGLSQHLTMHHSIEAYIFPVLAKKMPQFKAGARESGEHLKSHKGIHDGLEKYDKFLKDALGDTSAYNASVLRGIMDGFREVLFRHLDEEVKDLRGESLRAAGWTFKELSQIPM